MTKNEILAFAQQAGEELTKTMEAEYNERLAAILNSKGIETKIQSGFVYIIFGNEQIAVG